MFLYIYQPILNKLFLYIYQPTLNKLFLYIYQPVLTKCFSTSTNQSSINCFSTSTNQSSTNCFSTSNNQSSANVQVYKGSVFFYISSKKKKKNGSQKSSTSDFFPNEFIIVRAHACSKRFSKTTSTKSQCGMNSICVWLIWSVSCKLGNIKNKTPKTIKKNCSQSSQNIVYLHPSCDCETGYCHPN